jgi:5'(3')-deoxyribonucleotidase
MASSNIVLPKLVGTNYFYWRKRMQPIFITKDLWELVIDRYTMPYADKFKTLSDDDKKVLKEIIKKDNEALSLIGSTVEESIFTKINVAESSKQAWDILKNTYEGVVVAKLQTLRRNFENANM